MLTLPLIAALSQMVSKMKIICFGDFDQLNPCFNSWRGKPIEENVFAHSQLLKTLSENTIFKLTKCRRSDKAHFDFYVGLSHDLEEAKSAVMSRLQRRKVGDLHVTISHCKRRKISLAKQAAASIGKTCVYIPKIQMRVTNVLLGPESLVQQLTVNL